MCRRSSTMSSLTTSGLFPAVTRFERGSTFAVRRSALDFGLGGQRSKRTLFFRVSVSRSFVLSPLPLSLYRALALAPSLSLSLALSVFLSHTPPHTPDNEDHPQQPPGHTGPGGALALRGHHQTRGRPHHGPGLERSRLFWKRVENAGFHMKRELD